MSNSSAVSVLKYTSRAVVAAVGTLGLLLMPTRPSAAQESPPAQTRWELRVPSGALVPTGNERNLIKDAALSAVQVSYAVRPQLAITATLGWARSRDLVATDDPKVDVFSYDLGAEARAPLWYAGRRVTLSPFVGVGVGARSYNHRSLQLDATHNVAGYGAVGGEMGLGRARLRLELRDYVAGFKPLSGGGSASTQNDLVVMFGVSIARRGS